MPSSTSGTHGRGRHGSRIAGSRGYGLLDLVVAVAIVGLLAGIAVPAYRSQVLRANRTEARAALLALAAAEEKYYLRCNTYASALDAAAATTCEPPNLRFPERSERGHYSIEVSLADVTSWVAIATAVQGGPQAADTACRTLQLTSTGVKTAGRSDGTEGGVECWSR
jgi:type IV pilus assembly protein PilE